MTKITLELLQNVWEQHEPTATVQEFNVEPGSNQGDNYTSLVYRVTIKGFRKTPTKDSNSSTTTEEPFESSIICKCLPDSKLRREAFKSDALFCNELAFYTKIVPSFTQFQRTKDVSAPFKAIPKCYLAKADLIILEDLKLRSFKMADRRHGLTLEQLYLCLKVMADFHAISLAMKNNSPEEFYELLNLQDGISEGFFLNDNEEWYRSYYREATKNAIAMVEQELKGKQDADKYVRKFTDFCAEDHFFNKMVELVRPQEPLAVVSHGDCWTNNFMFRYADGNEITEVILVDFQMARYSSSALDVAYIIYLCTTREQRTELMSSLLEFYNYELHKRLIELTGEESIFNHDLNKETLTDLFMSDFRRAGLFALGIAVDMFPIMTCDSNEAPNLYQDKEPDSITAELVTPVWTSNEICRKKMTDLVQELVDNDIL